LGFNCRCAKGVTGHEKRRPREIKEYVTAYKRPIWVSFAHFCTQTGDPLCIQPHETVTNDHEIRVHAKPWSPNITNRSPRG